MKGMQRERVARFLTNMCLKTGAFKPPAPPRMNGFLTNTLKTLGNLDQTLLEFPPFFGRRTTAQICCPGVQPPPFQWV